MDIAFRSAIELAADIRQQRIGCRELLMHYEARYVRHNPALNAIVVTDFERAYRRADEADAALRRGEVWGPLHGVPMTVKESYDVQGMVTSWGAPEYADYRPVRNATSVDRLLAAGANIFGKTNVPLFLGDLQTFNAIYGTTRNPWKIEHTPGGSSGGAAAALAAGMTSLEAGSDIASSIRTPAHYCGIYGHKPTFGVITTRGQLVPGRAAYTDMAVLGPMARSAFDLEMALKVMAGPDEADGAAWRIELPKPRPESLAECRVAVLLETHHAPVDAEIRRQIQDVAEAIAKEGAIVSFEARPDFDTKEADDLFQRLLYSAFSGRQSDEVFEKNVEATRHLPAGDSSTRAEHLRASTLSHRDWLLANEARHRMRVRWAEFFDDWDVLLCPAAASSAPIHNHDGEPFARPIVVNGQSMPLSVQLFWAGYSGSCYLPSTVAPLGLTTAGLPVGVQIIGPQYGDLTCIRFAQLLERGYRGFVAPEL